MSKSVVGQLDIPPEYGNPTELLKWADVERKIESASVYWLASTRPNGRPHLIPRDGMWLDGGLYYGGSPATVHYRNITHNPHVVVHIGDGQEAIILWDKVEIEMPTTELATRLSDEPFAKYRQYGRLDLSLYMGGVSRWRTTSGRLGELLGPYEMLEDAATVGTAAGTAKMPTVRRSRLCLVVLAILIAGLLQGCSGVPEGCVSEYGGSSDEAPVSPENQLTLSVYALVDVKDVHPLDDPTIAEVEVGQFLWMTERGGHEWVPPSPATDNFTVGDPGCRWQDVADSLDDGERVILCMGAGGERGSYEVRESIVVITDDELSFIPETPSRAEGLARVTEELEGEASPSTMLRTLIEWNDEVNGSDRNKNVIEAWRALTGNDSSAN